MFRNSLKCTFAILALSLFFSSTANASPFNGKMSGSAFRTAFDLNSDGEAAFIAEGMGRITGMGKVNVKSMLEDLAWDGFSFCSATEVVLVALSRDTVIQAANGDLVYAVLTDDPDNEACFDFVDGSFRGLQHFEIAGGTGRFAGVTGQFTLGYHGKSIQYGVTDGLIFEGEFKGEADYAD